MSRVDTALQAYTTQVRSANPQKEIALLNGVVLACLEWIKKKKDKPVFKTSFFGKNTRDINTLFVKRKSAVIALGNAAIGELFTKMSAAGVMAPDVRGKLMFDKHKLAALTGGRAHMPVLKPMGQDYQPERSTYLASGKLKAISGSGVHSTHGTLHTYLKKDVHGKSMEADLRSQLLPKQFAMVASLAEKNVHNLTDADFRAFDEIGRALNATGDVTYLKKAERYKYMAIVGNDGRFYDYENNLMNTHSFKVTAYAMDEYGNLFCKDADALGEAFFFNHSSFNAGKDVICAGTLTIENGYLKTIDNNSGHYKPTLDNLHNCLNMLVLDNIDLSQTTVNAYVFIAGVKWEYKYAGLNFHADKASEPAAKSH